MSKQVRCSLIGAACVFLSLSYSVRAQETQASAPVTFSVESQPAESERVSEPLTRVAEAEQAAQPRIHGGRPAASGPPVSASDSGRANATTEEIIVTAQKRDERLQDVPVPVTALAADALVGSNQLRIQDYYTRVPGLTLSPTIQSSQLLAIRGITTAGGSSGGNPTVGIMVDDVPYGSSTGLGGALQVPDFDPSDLARVEVLRGPQGTLYGASSLGGLMKFVTLDPSTTDFSAHTQAGVSGASASGETGYHVRGAVNVPIGEGWGVRASAFTRRDPGYIDNPVTGLEDVNTAQVSGGRLSAMWRPSDDLSLKVSGLYQDSKADGSSDVFPALGDLKQGFAVAGVGGYETKSEAYSATLKAKLGSAELTSLTGYNHNRSSDSLDYIFISGATTAARFGAGVTSSTFVEDQKGHKLSEELRLSMPLGDRFVWLVGGFYTDESNSWLQIIQAQNPTTGAVAGEWQHLNLATTFEESAAFTDLTVHFTDKFDVQFGGRYSEIRQSYRSHRYGPLVAGGELTIPIRHSSASAITYLVTPQYAFSPDMMAYARLASGYRAGGPNTTAALVAGLPPEYDPDKTRNYEIGFKGALLDDVLSFDASIYYIDWKDIQLSLTSPVGGYLANGSRAKSQGVELSIDLRPLKGLSINTWAAYCDAVLTEDLPPGSSVFGRAGNRLSLSARLSGNLTIEQEFPLMARATGFVGASVSYVGERLSAFRGVAGGVPLPRQTYPSYARTDLHAGVRNESWTASAFVNNIADRRGVIGGGLGAFIPTAFNYIQPRTFGFSFDKSF